MLLILLIAKTYDKHIFTSNECLVNKGNILTYLENFLLDFYIQSQ